MPVVAEPDVQAGQKQGDPLDDALAKIRAKSGATPSVDPMDAALAKIRSGGKPLAQTGDIDLRDTPTPAAPAQRLVAPTAKPTSNTVASTVGRALVRAVGVADPTTPPASTPRLAAPAPKSDFGASVSPDGKLQLKAPTFENVGPAIKQAVMAVPNAIRTLVRASSEQDARNAIAASGGDPDNVPHTDDPKDVALAAAQLSSLALAPGVGNVVESMMARAGLSKGAAAVAGKAAASALPGAAFNPKHPAIGATLGAVAGSFSGSTASAPAAKTVAPASEVAGGATAPTAPSGSPTSGAGLLDDVVAKTEARYADVKKSLDELTGKAEPPANPKEAKARILEAASITKASVDHFPEARADVPVADWVHEHASLPAEEFLAEFERQHGTPTGAPVVEPSASSGEGTTIGGPGMSRKAGAAIDGGGPTTHNVTLDAEPQSPLDAALAETERRPPTPREYIPESSGLSTTEPELITRNITRALKQANPDAIAHAAPEMAQRIPPNAILVPLPDHQGSTVANAALANAIAQEHGQSQVADVLTRTAQTPSAQESRQSGKPGPTADEHAASIGLKPGADDIRSSGQPVVLIDNVETTGATAEGARRVLGTGADLVTFAKAPTPAGEAPVEASTSHAHDVVQRLGLDPKAVAFASDEPGQSHHGETNPVNALASAFTTLRDRQQALATRQRTLDDATNPTTGKALSAKQRVHVEADVAALTQSYHHELARVQMSFGPAVAQHLAAQFPQVGAAPKKPSLVDKAKAVATAARTKAATIIAPELANENRALTRAANTDALTGLGNQGAYHTALPRAEADPETSVVRFDLNGFKAVNDLAGHEAGDTALKSVAAAIHKAAPGLPSYRVGGDEFAVLAPKATAEATRDAIEKAVGVNDVGKARYSISGGVGATDAEADGAASGRKQGHKAEQGIGARGESSATIQHAHEAGSTAGPSAESTEGRSHEEGSGRSTAAAVRGAEGEGDGPATDALRGELARARAENERLKQALADRTAGKPVAQAEPEAGVAASSSAPGEIADEFDPTEEDATTDAPRARTEGGRLKSLRLATDEELRNEYRILLDQNSQENTAGYLARDENFHTMNDGRSFLVTGQAAAYARGRVKNRQVTIAKLEAEMTTRGMEHFDAYKQSAQDLANQDPTAFNFGERKPRGYDPHQIDAFAVTHDGSPAGTVADAPKESDVSHTAEQKDQVAAIIKKIDDLGLPTAPRRARQIAAGLKIGIVDPVGMRMGTPEEAGQVMVAFRHPSMEILHAFLKKDGVVVGHLAISTGAIDYSMVPESLTRDIVSLARATGATSWSSGHNHPSGHVSASSDDYMAWHGMESAVERQMPELSSDGHLIIDHDTALSITLDRATRTAHTTTIPIETSHPWVTSLQGGLPMVRSPGELAGYLAGVGTPESITVAHFDRQQYLIAIEPRLAETAQSVGSWLRGSMDTHASHTVVFMADRQTAEGLARLIGGAQRAIDPTAEWAYPVTDIIGIQYDASGTPEARFSHAAKGDVSYIDRGGSTAVYSLKPGSPASEKIQRARAGALADATDSGGPATVRERTREEVAPAVSFKNADSATQRERLGMDERTVPEPRTQDEMYEAGKTEADANPDAIPRLLADLHADPERIVGTKIEAGLLLKYRVDLERDLQSLIAAKDAAVQIDDVAAQHVADLQLTTKRADIRTFVELAERTGTATGRALAARRMMSTLDYSLSAMESNAETAKGEPLTSAELDHVKALYDELVTKLAAAERDTVEARERAAKAEADLHHAELKLEAAGPILARVQGRLNTAAMDAKARIRARGLRAMAGIDPELLRDYAIVGAAEIADGAVAFVDWADRMRAAFGDEIVPHLDEIHDAANKQLDQETTSAKAKSPAPKVKAPSDIRGKMAARAADGADLTDLRPYLRQLALEQIRAGNTTRDGVLDALHADVRKVLPDVTREEVRDALSGYGDFSPLNKAADETRLREIRAEAQKLAQLEALAKGEAPRATGFERAPMNDETRRLVQQVYAAKKAMGIGDVDDETRLKSALSSAKTRTRNAIKDLQSEIDTGERIVKGRPVLISDAELDALKSQLTELRKVEAEVFKDPGLTDEQRVARAIQAAKRAADSWDARLEKARGGTFATPQRLGASSPELDALRASAKLARAEYEELKAIDPTQRQLTHEKWNAQYRARLAKREAELLERLAKADYTARARRPSMMMDEASRIARAAVEEVKARFRADVQKYEYARRPAVVKAADFMAAWVRTGVLTSMHVFEHLTGAAISRLVTIPLEQVVGYGLSKAMPRLAAAAPRHGVPSLGGLLRAEAAAQTRAWTEGLRGSGRLLLNKRTTLDLMHEPHGVPPRWYEYFGSLHQAFKNPIFEGEYARSYQARTEHALRNGVNTANPLEHFRLSNEAFVDAQHAVLKQDNRIVKAQKAMLQSLEKRDKDGNVSVGPLLLATGIRLELPIVKIPMNYVQEISEHVTGLATGGVRAARAYHKGRLGGGGAAGSGSGSGGDGDATISPEDADVIMRQMKKGTVGAGLLVLGYILAAKLGGLYLAGQKRRDVDDIQAGDIGDIRKPWLHSPQADVLQMGATIRQVAESFLKKTDEDPQGIGAGIEAAIFGIAELVPFVRETSTIEKLINPRTRDQALATKAAGMLVPAGVQQVAQLVDHGTVRDPHGLKEHLEANLPVLRQRVPGRLGFEPTTTAQRKMADFLVAHGPATAEQSMRAKLVQQLRDGTTTADVLFAKADRGELTESAYAAVVDEADMPPLAAQFKRLNVSEARRVYALGTPEERDLWKDLMDEKENKDAQSAPRRLHRTVAVTP